MFSSILFLSGDLLFSQVLMLYPFSGISELVELVSRAKMVIEYHFIEIIYLQKSGAEMASSPSYLSVQVSFHFCILFYYLLCPKSPSPELLVLWTIHPCIVKALSYLSQHDLLFPAVQILGNKINLTLKSNPKANLSSYDSN